MSGQESVVESVIVEALKGIFGYIWQLLQVGFLNVVSTFKQYNLIDFVVFFYVGYLLGILLGRVFGLLGDRLHWTTYIVFSFVYYLVFADCFIVTKHPLAFGIGTSFTILTIINLIQRPKGINYKDVALIFPLFLREKSTETSTFSYLAKQNEREVREFLERMDRNIEEFNRRAEIKRKEKKKIESKIDELIRKLDNF